MKLYHILSDKKPSSITGKELLIILRQCGCENNFIPYKGNEQFINFVFYFIHAYSFESTLMDTQCFQESLSLIESNFDFDFDKFKTGYDETFDENYSTLITFYLKAQRNRQYELLMTGLKIYDQILLDSTKTDAENRRKLFLDAIEVDKQLKLIETELWGSLQLIEKTEPEIKKEDEKEVREIRLEDQHLKR